MDAAQILDNIDRRLYELEQLMTSSVGPGNNVFDQIIINGPGGAPPVIVKHSADPPQTLSVTPGSYFDNIFADVSWVGPADDSADHYQIEWAKKNGPGDYELINVNKIHGNSFRIDRLIPDQDYGVRVYSISTTGIPSTPIPASGFTDFFTEHDDTLPAPPGGITIVSTIKSLICRIVSSSSIDVLNGNGTYKFELSTDSGFSTILKINIEGGLVSYFPDLEVNTQYWVRASALDASGNQSATYVTGNAITSYLVGSDTSMVPSGSNLVKNSIFIRQAAVAGYPDYWDLFSGAVSLTEGVHTVADAGFQGGQGLQFKSTLGIDDHSSQPFTLTKGKWCIGCKVKRTSVVSTGGQGSGMNIVVMSGSVSFVRDWTTTSPGTGSSHAPSQIFTGTNAIRWEWVVIDVTTASADIRLYLQQGFLGTCTGTTVFGEVQVEAGDTPTSWHGIPPQIVTADEVYAGSLTTATMTVNTINADRILGNTLDVAKIMTSSLTTQTITLNGGSIIAGSPPTNGVLFNSLGLRAYSGGVLTCTIDNTGAISITGAINATSGTLGSLSVTGTINIASGAILTNNGTGTYLKISSALTNEVSFFSGHVSETARGFLQVNSGGSLVIQAPTISGTSPGSISMLSDIVTVSTARSNMTLRSTGTDDLWNNTNIHGNVSMGQQIIIGNTFNASITASSSAFGTYDGNWGIRWDSSGGSLFYVRGVYYADHSGSSRLWGVYDQNFGVNVAYADDFAAWIVPSSIAEKTKIKNLKNMEQGSLAKVLKFRPVRYHRKSRDGKKISPKPVFGHIAEEMHAHAPEAVSMQGRGKNKLVGINHAALSALHTHSIQELHEIIQRQQKVIDKLVGRVDRLDKAS